MTSSESFVEKSFSNGRVVDDNSVPWIADVWEDCCDHGDGAPHFAFVQVPFDLCVSHRPGARFGPKQVLRALDGYSMYCVDKHTDLTGCHISNCGVVNIVNRIEQNHTNIADTVGRLPLHTRAIIIGGDHSISDPSFRAMQKRSSEPIGLVVFDAHLDSRRPVTGKEHSGHWFYTLNDVLDYRSTAQVGITASIYASSYMKQAIVNQVLVVTPYEFRRLGVSRVAKRILAHVRKRVSKIYLSVDIDVIDQAFAPGTSVPNPAGLHTHEVADSVFEIASAIDTVGLDITEVSPPLDTDDRTSHVAAQIIFNYMSGVCQRHGQGT